MKIIETDFPGVLILEPRVFRDERGFFVETWHQERYRSLGLATTFVQDNLSSSVRGTLRGMHFQNPRAQGKLVTVLQGRVYDVVVDLRVDEPTFGRWISIEVDADQMRQLWIPEGFAHGFQVLSPTALFSYKCSTPYAPQYERAFRWDDPDVGIDWPLPNPRLSPKDAAAPLLRELAPEHLFLRSTRSEPPEVALPPRPDSG